VAGWLTLIKAVPWGDVIAAAPTVVAAAKRLIGNARRESAQTATEQAHGRVIDASPDDRVDVLEKELSALQEQLLASSKLIEQIAEQNAQLVARVEMHRRRLKALTAVIAVMGVVVGMLIVMARHS
jgi:septal ring factor EnvC (AmiA/AmiB activator)